MSENGRFVVIVGAVAFVVALTIFLVVILRPGGEAVDTVKEETVVQPIARASRDVASAADEPEEEPEAGPTEIEVEEKAGPVTVQPKHVAQVPAEPQEHPGEIEDIMAALEYRDDFCPDGYEVPEMTDRMPNRGPFSQPALDEFVRETGVAVEIQDSYLCAFLSEGNKALAYMVFKLADQDGASAMADAMEQLFATREQARKADTFVIRNYMVATICRADLEDTGVELMGKLKQTVNYTD